MRKSAHASRISSITSTRLAELGRVAVGDEGEEEEEEDWSTTATSLSDCPLCCDSFFSPGGDAESRIACRLQRDAGAAAL